MGTILTEPVTGPVAWRGSELAQDDRWIARLSRAELAQLDAALRSVQRRGLAVPWFAREDFPLDSLAARLEGIGEDLERGRGFALLRGLPVDAYSEEELATLYWGIGTHLGIPVSQNERGHVLGHVRDEGASLSDVRARGYQTHESQGLHIDSCDVVGLLCLRSAKSGGMSQIASSMTIYNELLRRYPWYVGLLHRPFAFDKRGQERPGDPPVYRRTIYSYYAGRLSCAVNFTYIRSAQAKSGITLSEVELEALTRMEEIAYEVCFEMAFEPGDMQFLNNYVILHDRTPYVDYPEPERKRHLLRLWLSARDPRPLAPDFRSVYAELLKSYQYAPRV